MSVRKRKWITRRGEAKEAWIVDYADRDGTRRLKTFEKKKEADTYAATVNVEVREGTHVPERASATLSKAGELWIRGAKAAGLERSTIETYRYHLNFMEPFLGTMKLSQISVATVRAFEDWLRTEGRSAVMVRKVMRSLGTLLADAHERGLVARNVVRELRQRRRRKDGTEERHNGRLKIGVEIPTPEEIRAIVGALGGRWRPLVLTAIFTGLRASELRGLRWSDVDLDKGELHVRQRADKFNTIGKPKSRAGERTVPLPPIIRNTLREWKLACPKGDLGLVFPNGSGNVEMLSNIIRRGLKPTLKSAGVAADYGMHSFRHFYASWCINRRADGGLELPPKTVQQRLGHASIVMTLDVYGHLFPRVDDSGLLAEGERALLGA